jgi:translation initiation factor 1
LDRCTCDQPRSARPIRPEPKVAQLPRDGIVRLLRDRKGRGGKTVTLVTGLTGSAASLTALATDLKRMCGTGGTLRGDILELQGDFRDRLQTELERRGYTVRVAGA